ncbi:MAG: site-specific integrase, partial [Methylobacter sp.]
MHPDAELSLADFFEQLSVEVRASEHTVKSYRRDMKQLSLYCTDKGINHWTDLKHTDVRSHIAGR